MTVLKNLKKKVTNRVVAKIDEIVSKEMKKMLQQKPEEERADDEQILKHEIAALKNDWLFLQSGEFSCRRQHIRSKVRLIYTCFRNLYYLTRINLPFQKLNSYCRAYS